jgi:hypothetical protein
MEEQKLYFIDQIKSYDEIFKLDKEISINCYSKKQLEAVSPKEDRKFLGEFAKDSKKDKIAQFEVQDDVYPMYEYKAHNRFAFAEKGFVKCTDTENTYIVLLKDVLWMRVLITLLLLALLGGGIFTATKYLTSSAPPAEKVLTSTAPQTSNAEDSPLAIDPNAVPSDSDDGKPAEKNKTPYAKVPSLKKVEIAANSPYAHVDLKNPEGNASAILTLTIDGEEIAKTGLIPGGNVIKQLKLKKLLSKGTYKGTLIWQFYDSAGNKLNTVRSAVDIEAN